MNRLQLNLALLVLALGLGGALYFSAEEKAPGAPLTAIAEDALTRIAIEHPGRPAIVLEKQKGAWRLTAPVSAAADPLEVASLTNLAGLERKRELPVAGLALAELGLAPAAYTVRLNDQVLEFGAVEPIEFRRYIRRGETVALTEDPPSTALDADYSDLVAKDLLPPGAEILEIQVPGLSLRRAADSTGWSLGPGQADVCADRKQKLVDAWRGARAMWNALRPEPGQDSAENPAQGLDEPVRIVYQGGSLDLRVIAREPQLILENPATKVRYTLSKALEGELLRLPEETPPAAAEPPVESAS